MNPNNLNNLNNPQPQGLVWSERLDMRGLETAGVEGRRQAIQSAQSSRPKITPIEREILVAVIVLYAAILGGFAFFHIYGSLLANKAPAEQSTEQTIPETP
ncbi:MAG: hypothetical protein N2035_05095 [Chthoniobacterales bacterium]|nr:hypothetical protein [Chthoniobacterales bacterium]MCX7713025.1 hypothetical protein [Chthoniobacterales bacterium]